MEFQLPSLPSKAGTVSQPSMYDQYKNGLGTSQFTNPSDTWNNFLQLYYPNAFQAAMLNYQNEYNSPINQMLRYQEAGINPYSAIGNISAQSAQGSQGSGPGTSHTPGVLEKIASIAKNVAGAVNPALEAGIRLFDYLNYGKQRSFLETGLAGYNASAARSKANQAADEAAWAHYWNTGEGSTVPGTEYSVQTSPRAKYMENSSLRLQAQIKQLEGLVDMIYPSQKEANEARAALQRYALEVQQGRNDAVLNINTGSETADLILKFVSYLLMDNSRSLIGLLGN